MHDIGIKKNDERHGIEGKEKKMIHRFWTRKAYARTRVKP
jgi:hypothetical protein